MMAFGLDSHHFGKLKIIKIGYINIIHPLINGPEFILEILMTIYKFNFISMTRLNMRDIVTFTLAI
jgi:hypothetical protein